MKIVTNPSNAVRVSAYCHELLEEDDLHRFIMSPEKFVGLCISIPFKSILYMGTTSFYLNKINKEVYYSYSLTGPWYQGDAIKKSLRILYTKRIRIWIHKSNFEDPNYMVLLLGTKEGTIAIAPKVEKPYFETRRLIDIMRKPTNKLKRALTFGGIF